MSQLKETRVNRGYEQITVLSSSTGINGAAGATLAVIVVEGQNVRYRDDGTDPSASVGMPVPAGASINYDGTFDDLRFIEVAAGAILNISYYS